MASGNKLPPPMYRKLPAKKDNIITIKKLSIETKKVTVAPKTGAIASTNNILIEDFRLLPEFNIRAKVLMPSQKS